MSAAIFVAGSLNADLMVRVERLPAAGMTVSATDVRRFCGGKGANQAVAAAKLGGRVRMIGRVGDDAEGTELLASLSGAGVDVEYVVRTSACATGVAYVFVQDDGQNQIVVASGANERLTAADIEAGLADARAGDLLLLQLESPVDVVETAARLARRRGLTVILDPAPARPLSPELLESVHVLTPNESEGLTLLGRVDADVSEEHAGEVAGAVRTLGADTAILKLGARGAILSDARGIRAFAAPTVQAIDTTAAGDTFNGALAVILAEGQPFETALAFANLAASLSVTRAGAQASMPTRAEVEEFRRQL
jgi:ribokinase